MNKKIGFNKRITAMGLGFTLVVVAGSVHAQLMNFSTIGDVMIGQENAPNIYGLSAGDTITANGTFDDSGLVAGTGSILFDAATPSSSLMITLGSVTLYGSDDISYLTGGYPELIFNNYQLVEFNFLSADFSSWGLGFDDTYSLLGEWRPAVEFAPVPAPTALWLLGSGLIGLAGFMYKKQ
jgi:hypothetical protein